MSKCKNCGEETKKNNVYCSLKCRNIYVNKNLRDYTKVKETFKKKNKDAETQYLINPIYCKNCGEIIPFNKVYKNTTFCNRSCSAKYNNTFRKGIKHNLSEQGRKILIESAYKNFVYNRKELVRYVEQKKNYYENPNKCSNCSSILEFKYRNKIFCNLNCKKEYFAKNKDNFELYRFLTKFKFNLNEYKTEFDFSLIEKYGWYKAKNNGDNVDGVSRDHNFSVGEGFRRLINPLLLAHPANCELVLNRKNQSKNDNCSISLEYLLEKIEQFKNKYGKYYNKEIKIYINLNELKDIYMQS